jgi:hypothetical protein
MVSLHHDLLPMCMHVPRIAPLFGLKCGYSRSGITTKPLFSNQLPQHAHALGGQIFKQCAESLQ